MTTPSMPLSRFLMPFRSSLVQRNCSKRTQEIYTCQVQDFIRYFEKNENIHLTLADFDLFHVESYLGALSLAGKAPKTIALARTVLQSFGQFLVHKRYIENNPVHLIPPPRLPKPLPKPLRIDEIKALLRAVDRSKIRGKRDYAILLTFLLSGLRVAEMAALQIPDINFDTRHIEVRHGKGSKDRLVPIPSALREVLRDYIQNVRPHYHCSASTHGLWVGRQGVLTPLSLREIVYEYRDQSGLTYRKLSPHTLRATYATLVSQACQGDLLIVRDLLGHANIQTTTVYVEVSQEQKQVAVEALSAVTKFVS
jgi:site-specific recombinase XerD